MMLKSINENEGIGKQYVKDSSSNASIRYSVVMSMMTITEEPFVFPL